MNRKAVPVALVIGLSVIAGCSKQRTQANEWGCSFGDGPYDSRDLKHSYAPGEKGPWSNDRMVTGPADVRFFFVDNDAATADFGSRPIIVPARGSSTEGVGFVDVQSEVQVRFVTNENFCDLYVDNLKRIDDRTDLNYNAAQGESSGWAEFLINSMNQKVIEATRPVLRTQDYITLSVNGPIPIPAEDDPATEEDESTGPSGQSGLAYDVLGDELSANLSRELDKDLGGTFFCGPGYRFDGTIDGILGGTGCPPLEVTVKSIKPVDPELLANLAAIVKNEEAERKLISDTQLANKTATEQASRAVAQAKETQRQAEQDAISRQAVEIANANAQKEILVNQATADQATQVAQATAQEQIELAQETRRRNVEEAKAATDLAVAVQRAPVATQLAANKTADQVAEAAYCVELARVNIRCDLLASAEEGSVIVPTINLSGSADGASAGATVVLDARP